MATYSVRVDGRLAPKFIDHLSVTKPGEIFEVELETEGLTPENGEQAVAQLLQLESEFEDLRVVYIDTCSLKQKVIIQFVDAGPGFISLAGVLSAIPTLLIVVGVFVLAFILYQVILTNPWALFFLALGGSVVILALLGVWRAVPTVQGIRTQAREVARIEGKPSALAMLREKRTSYHQILVEIRDEADKLRSDREKVVAERIKAKKKRDKAEYDTLTGRLAELDQQILEREKEQRTYTDLQKTVAKEMQALS